MLGTCNTKFYQRMVRRESMYYRKLRFTASIKDWRHHFGYRHYFSEERALYCRQVLWLWVKVYTLVYIYQIDLNHGARHDNEHFIL